MTADRDRNTVYNLTLQSFEVVKLVMFQNNSRESKYADQEGSPLQMRIGSVNLAKAGGDLVS